MADGTARDLETSREVAPREQAASTTSVLEAAKTAHRPTFEVRRDESRRPLDREQACKNLTIFATLLALALETAVTGTWLDYVG